MNKVKFGSFIKESRLKKNYTQQDLADFLFVDVSTVSKWERGVSYPDITLVPDICKVLEISEHELIESSRDEHYRKIEKEASRYNYMRKSAFWTLNISYLLAILVCFIVNLAVNHTLSWFFIVLTSIMCAYTFCPTITWVTKKFKKSLFVVSTLLSMSLLFVTCSVYLNDYWCLIAIVGTFLGYFIIFYPLLFKEQKKYLAEDKYKKLSKIFLLSYLIIMFILVNLLLISIYVYIPFNLSLGLLITGVLFMVPTIYSLMNFFEACQSITKPFIVVVLSVLTLIILCLIGRAVYFKFTEEEKVYLIEETYNDIKIEGNTFDINIYVSNEDKVVSTENKKVTIESKVVDNTLIIKQKDEREFYDKLISFGGFEFNLYLTESTINSLNINNKTGDIEIKGFTFNSVVIESSTGDIEIDNSSLGNLSIDSSTGDVELTGVTASKLDITTSTGDTELVKVVVSDDFNMTGKTGDLYFEEFDAKNIYITLSTGDVKGTLLSSKIFNANSKTGNVSVPETYEGGICKIKVSTGNIRISYK